MLHRRSLRAARGRRLRAFRVVTGGQRIHDPVPDASLPPTDEAFNKWCGDHLTPVGRARERLSVRPKRYRSGRAGRQHGNATRLVRKERSDGSPFKVREFIPHDSRLRFGSLNHVQTDAFNPQNRPFRDYPKTGHPDDMPKSTRMTYCGL